MASKFSLGLQNLKPAPGSRTLQKRLGRGQGSRYGGTSGRGHKGQKARSGNGKPKAGFEGGQTSIAKLFPKRGFKNSNQKDYTPINLEKLQYWMDSGRLKCSPDNPITARSLQQSGFTRGIRDGIKLLGDGAHFLQSPVYITPNKASKSAIKAVEQMGGYVYCVYATPLTVRNTVRNIQDKIQAGPIKRADIEWYTQWQNRGYLSRTALSRMPASLVQPRWHVLSETLSKWKVQARELVAGPKSRS